MSSKKGGGGDKRKKKKRKKRTACDPAGSTKPGTTDRYKVKLQWLTATTGTRKVSGEFCEIEGLYEGSI